ncbi:hypothetical protein CVT25_011694 [Psilocybe cyanescens]|uniref:Uncharacterized protein n=1 Tax=Psilocybe cyanescens TaxID=93625 RepID=A0A409WIJ0_PSICY|nr:hypothetical protein CVT25_011694 [Psilocybe cyanescens]
MSITAFSTCMMYPSPVVKENHRTSYRRGYNSLAFVYTRASIIEAPTTKWHPIRTSRFIKRSGELPVETMDIFLDIIITLQMVGFVGCALTLGTVIFSKVYRRPTWLSFMITWTVSSISYLLLFFSGQLENPKPPFGLCIIQASLIYAVPPLCVTSILSVNAITYHSNILLTRTSASTLALVAQVCSLLDEISTPLIFVAVRSLFIDRVRQHERIWNVILGLNDPSTVHRSSLATPYCSITNLIPSRIASIAVAALLLPTLVLEGIICKILKDNWSVIKGSQSLLSTAVRVLGFSLLGMVAIALSLVFASTSDRNPAMNIVISLMPPAAFSLFGTQWDIIGVWMFWKTDSSAPARNTISSESELSELVNKAPQAP